MPFSTLLALTFYFIAMLAIGLYSYRRSSTDLSAYMLGGRSLPPSVAALSAGASDMSGWILMGLPGAMFISGISSSWIAIGLILGAWLNYALVGPRLRHFTEHADDALTLPDFFAKRFNDSNHTLRIASAVIIIVFFTLYTSSGLVAGGKLFESSFHLDYQLGMLITMTVVVLYTLFGGFLAVSLTDFVQGCIMFIALILVPYVAWTEIQNVSQVNQAILQNTPDYFDWFAGVSLATIASSLAWGLGYFGQPHILVRFMALRSIADMPAMRRIGMSWMIISLIGALATGYMGVAYLTQSGQSLNDGETVFIYFAQLLFHPLITGFLLAAILAAIMSTISSQLLVSSSSLTDDFYKRFIKRNASNKELVVVGRLSVALVAIIASLLALSPDSSILNLVSNAWAGFGAAFGPLVVFSLYWPTMSRTAALAGMISGAGTVLFWIYAPININGQTLSSLLYEMIPGVLVSSLAIVLVTKLKPDTHPMSEKLFALKLSND